MPDYFSLVDMRKFDLNPSEAGIVGEMLRSENV